MSPSRKAVLYPSKGGCRASTLLQRVDTWGKRHARKGVGAQQRHSRVGYEGVAGGKEVREDPSVGTHADWRLGSSVTSAGQCKVLVATSHGG